jgi:hypothetical protein
MTRLEEDFATLDRSRPEARGSRDVFDGAQGVAHRRRNRTRFVAALGVTLVVVLGGVALAQTGGDGSTSVDSGFAGPGAQTTVSPTTAEPDPTAPSTTAGPDPSAPPMTTTSLAGAPLDVEDLVDIRVLSAGGADQVIFELAPEAGAVLEGAYVEDAATTELPLDCAPADLDAPAFLVVHLGEAAQRNQQAVPPDLAQPRSYEDARRVESVSVACVFDGEVLAVIGLQTGEVAHRVEALEGPPRLLVELYPG